MSHAHHHAAEHGITRLILDVLPASSDVIGFYGRVGQRLLVSDVDRTPRLNGADFSAPACSNWRAIRPPSRPVAPVTAIAVMLLSNLGGVVTTGPT